MKMLEKKTDCESLEISQENLYDGVSFSKVTNIKKKKKEKKSSFWEKKNIAMDQRLNKVAAQ